MTAGLPRLRDSAIERIPFGISAESDFLWLLDCPGNL